MAHIVSIAEAAPVHVISQVDLASQMAKACRLNESETEWLQRVYRQSEIATRYSVLADFGKDVDSWSFWNGEHPTTQKRNEVYKREAKLLSLQACQKAIDDWGEDPLKITHIIYVSCTGIVVPGVQAYLQEALKLRESVQQFGLNMMGCFGAFKGLAIADAFCAQNPEARVLVVCTELCSLHFQMTKSREQHVGNALFGDASAACIVAALPKSQEKSLYTMVRHKSLIIPNTSEKMSWDVSDHGFVFGLKEDVPHLIEQHVAAFVSDLLPAGITPQECLWPVHPGGKSILKAVERALCLSKEQMLSSWQVLKNYGNVSSPTFLLVLRHMRSYAQKRWAVGIGFGPGLCIEGMLLEIS